MGEDFRLQLSSRLVAILALAVVVIGLRADAHDVEPIGGEPSSDPPYSFLDCEEGLAGAFPCANTALVSTVPLGLLGSLQANDLWGWTDPETGVEYALLGLANGTAFIDLARPDQPVVVGILPTHTQTSSWRDIKVNRDYAFIVSEARSHGLQVFDLGKLREVTNPPVEFESDAHHNGFGSAHNVVINEQSGYAYAVGTDFCGGGLYMIDINDPLDPTFAGCFSEDGYTHDAQCVVYAGPDFSYLGHEICLGSNEDTVTIVDVTDKANPRLVSRTPYAGSRYTHQGWLTEDHAFFLVDDELDESIDGIQTRTLVFDVADLDTPFLAGFHQADSTAIDHNLYVKGNHVFQANYRSGIRILRMGDLSQAELVEVAFFDTIPADDFPRFSGTWSVYPYFESGLVIASDILQGLFVLRPDLAAVPQCDDGIDNDRDGQRDYPEDTTCLHPDSASESERRDIEIALRPPALGRRHEVHHRRRALRVAILGSNTVDVRDVDLQSLRMGPGNAAPLPVLPQRLGRGPLRVDVNRDRYPDIVLRFGVHDTGLLPDDDEICLTGALDSEDFRACAPIEPNDEHGPAVSGGASPAASSLAARLRQRLGR
jgi:choice-of-anchor B domain-containing protein